MNFSLYFKKNSLFKKESISKILTFIVLIFGIYFFPLLTYAHDATNLIGQLDVGNNPVYTTSDFDNGEVITPNARGLAIPTGVTVDEVHHRLFLADRGNHRVLVFDLDSSNHLIGHEADYVLGQQDFDTSDTGTTASNMDRPNDLAYDPVNNLLYVVDQNNVRVLVFDVSTITSGENAIHVLGQPDFFSSNNTTFEGPGNIALDVDGGRLFVSDQYDAFVYVFDVNSITDGEPPVNILGRTDLDRNAPFTGTPENSFGNTNGLAYDAINNRLFVADDGNSRVMVFDVSSITNGEDAIHVLGQPNFASTSPNTTKSGLNKPYGLSYNPNTDYLYVSDKTDNRVLVYDVATITNGEDAIDVFGQDDYVSSDADTTASNVDSPMGVYISPSTSKLYVADSGNNRVPIFNAASATPNITNCEELQNMELNLSGNYTLANDIDCSDTINWNGGEGFEPVGGNFDFGSGDPFTGTLDGQGFKITDLYIHNTIGSRVGLFGVTNTGFQVMNLGMENVSVYGEGDKVGSIAGWIKDSSSTVSNCYAAGTVIKGSTSYGYVGGLVGENRGDTIDSHFIGDVTMLDGGGYVAGLVAFSYGGWNGHDITFENNYFTGNVDSPEQNGYVGGLIGYAYKSSVIDSHADGGTVTTGGAEYVGGLIAYQSEIITQNSYSEEDVVSEGQYVGGLIGHVDNNDEVIDSYATGDVTATGSSCYAGGLIGESGVNITNSYATGDLNSGDDCYVGGLVGYMYGNEVTNSYSTGAITGGLNNYAGGFIGYSEASTITNSYANGNVTGDDLSYIGGFIGQSLADISQSYSTGDITGATNGITGGFVGVNDGTINESYSTGDVSGLSADTGGLVGNNTGTIANSYAHGNVSSSDDATGGLVGNQSGTIDKSYSKGIVTGTTNTGGLLGIGGGTTNSFWDTENSGEVISSGGTGKTTLEMQDVGTYTNLATPGLTNAWDFNTIWDICPPLKNDGYPFFQWQTFGGSFPPCGVSKYSPTIDTTPSAGGVVGTVLNDSATLSGGSSPTGDITFNLFAPTDSTCSLAPVYTDTDSSSPYGTTGGYTSLVEGTYHWTAEYAGDSNNFATSSPCIDEAVVITAGSTSTPPESTPHHSHPISIIPPPSTPPQAPFIPSTIEPGLVVQPPPSPPKIPKTSEPKSEPPIPTQPPSEIPEAPIVSPPETIPNTPTPSKEPKSTKTTSFKIKELVENNPAVKNLPIIAVAYAAVASQVVNPFHILKVLTSAGGFAEVEVGILSSYYGLLGLLGLRQKRKHWGTVFDSKNKQPVDPVYLSLIDTKTNEEIDSAVTDITGRYGFLVKPGSYIVQAGKTNYSYPSKFLAGKEKDSIYNNLYFGQVININSESEVIAPNIPMDPVTSDWNQEEKQRMFKFHPRSEAFLNNLSNFLLGAGFIISSIAFLYNHNLFNLIVIVIYLAIGIYKLFFKKRLWGRIYSSITGNVLPGALLELALPGVTGVTVAKAITNKNGQFFLKGDKGKYNLKISKINSISGESNDRIGESTVKIDEDGLVNEDIRV